MEYFDDRIKTLQKRSLQVLPLHYRRETPQKMLPIEALCEFDTDEVWTVLLKVKLVNVQLLLLDLCSKKIDWYNWLIRFCFH